MPKGKIGVFDSGLGGLTILKEIVMLMPNREYIYLGDNARAPYGDKSQEEIFKFTLAGAEWLFNQGAEIVILACNTASSKSLRRIQQEVLPVRYPEKKLLGIIIPSAEEIEKYSPSGHIGILATPATVLSNAFETEMKKSGSKALVTCQSGGRLANLVETDDEASLSAEIKNVVDGLIKKDKLIDMVFLGCTHYALIAEKIKEILPPGVKVMGQGELIAAKLLDYLNRHGEIRNSLSDETSIIFYTTSPDEKVKKLTKRFYGEDVLIQLAIY